MFEFSERTISLIGKENYIKLESSSVCVLGLGGVGGSCCEALVRAGVGRIILIDNDVFDVSNINRQLFSTNENIGLKKVDEAKKRLLSINPKLKVDTLPIFYNTETKDEIFKLNPNFIIDCIDTVSSKILLAKECNERSIPMITCLGTGNRLDPTQFKTGIISETAGCGCGLAKVLRSEFKKIGLSEQPVLYSTEIPKTVIVSSDNGRHSPASISFCPPVAGYILASYTIKYLIK